MRRLLVTAALLAFHLIPQGASGQKLVLGVATHLGQDRGDPDRYLSILKDAGIASFRDDFYWSNAERKQGSFSANAGLQRLDKAIRSAPAVRIEPLIILDYGNKFYDDGGFPRSEEGQAAFVRYAQYVASQYKGVVKQYEIWNEWNIGAGGRTGKRYGDPALYASLLKKVYAALKSIDPNVTVIGGAVADQDLPWIQALLKEGALAYMDGLSVHPYNFSAGKNATPENVIVWLSQLSDVLQSSNGGKPVPIYVTEVGWPNHEGQHGTSPGTTADNLARLLLLAPTVSSVRGIWWYEFQDSGTDRHNREHNFGLIANDYTPKPGICTLREVSRLISNHQFVAARQLDRGIWMVTYRAPGGQYAYSVWTSDPDAQQRTVQISFGKDAHVSTGDFCRPATVASENKDGGNTLNVRASTSPALVLSDGPMTQAQVR
jgi:hypothetical protein